MIRPTARRLAAGLETPRFALRNLGVLDAYRLTRRHWLPDPEIMASVGPRHPPRSPFRWFFSMERPNGRTKFTHAIHLRDGQALIGLNTTRLVPPSTATMTIAIHDRAWWGASVVPEVRRALIDALFDAGEVDRIAAHVLSRNLPSVFNYRLLGFAHVGTLHRATRNSATGEVEDVLIFELLRENWRAGEEAR